ncbi:MAG: class I SAM-dependent methyltransferase [Magnetococcales bacterium]|nr:class I SAM-dependent methyltransferase [Magnetococcales bacterium]
MHCRHCGAHLTLTLVDLGSAPPSNAYLNLEALHAPELWFPLRVLVCEQCWLVQTEDFAEAERLFAADYAYFSSFSMSWLDHCRRYVAEVVERFDLHEESLVVEIAANDGYLLQYVQEHAIPCLGVEPTASTATAARAKGIDIVEAFFGRTLARELLQTHRPADWIVANNVLAHVPDINDFVAGITTLLAPSGVVTFEFPHLLNLIAQTQFDTIYHEHFSYLSLTAVQRILAVHGLQVFDVLAQPTHGGSLRVFAQRTDEGGQGISERVATLLDQERAEGVTRSDYYHNFQERCDRIKNDLLIFLLEAKQCGRVVAGYGAAAKGTTLLNYAGVRSDLLRCVADGNPAKQGKLLPGCRIPIVDPETLHHLRPDYVVILPWNLSGEIMQQLAGIGAWGGRFVTAVPSLRVIDAAGNG